MSIEQGYYRFPTICGDRIAFVCEDDLWTVSADGGVARRLTANPGMISFPSYSPGGSSIAVTGRDDGPNEVYVLDAEGGPLRRVTWLGCNTHVVGWRPDGRSIVFASDWRQPFGRCVDLYSAPVEGGAPVPMKIGSARAISFQPGGPGVVIGRNTGDPARWKRYRGGTAGTIWIDRMGGGEFVELIRLRGNLAHPMWIGGRIFFLSDHEGYGNLYSCLPTGRGLKRHTHREDFYVRFPSTDGKRIACHAGADIMVFDPGTGEERKVEIRIASPRTQRARKFVGAARCFDDCDIHPQGHSIASTHRGGLYAMGLWEGAPRRIGVQSGVRYRLASWLPDGKRIAAVTDEGGEESLVVLAAVEAPPAAEAKGKGKPRSRQQDAKAPAGGGAAPKRIEGDFGRAVEMAVAPTGGDRVAIANHRHELILVDLATGGRKVIERSPYARIAGLSWSADGRWLAYGFPCSRRTCRIHLCEAASGKVTAVTRPDFNDVRPAFDPEGKYLYFISWRIFDPVYDSMYFDLGFPKGSMPFLIILRKDAISPFSAAMRPPRAPGAPLPDANSVSKPDDSKSGREKDKDKDKEKEKDKGKEKPAEPPKVEIDLEGIEDRVVPLPVSEGIYGRILGAKGRVLFTSYPVTGSLDTSWFTAGEPPARATLQAYVFADEKTETVSDRVTDFSLSIDAKVLGIRSGNRLRVVPVAFKAEGKTKEDPCRESGWVNMERLRVSVNPADEWRQMFLEAWRLQRDQFWTEDMSGHDWKAVRDRYLPLVDRVACRSEFSDLMWEMQGELGTSHCYELGGDYRPQPAWHQGFLGADIEYDVKAGTWRVGRIPRGDSWDEKRSSPLAAPGLNVRAGDEILEVAGQAVGRSLSPYECLVNASGQDVLLTIRSSAAPARDKGGKAPKPAPPAKRTIAVKTLREEYNLRYRDWVEANRERVHKQSGGRAGYIHIPNMGPHGYAEFHRYYLSEVDRDGLIIDVRYNGGGHVSQLLLEKLLRRRVGYDINRWGQPEPYPSDAPKGPMVALTNEHAGSDGDIFSHCFKLFKLGKLIGKRTWGGVIGIWPRHSLVDGTITTQPEFSFWFEDVGWGVENYGVDPDIEVDIRPQDYAAGRDPQLERGLKEVGKLLKGRKPAIPEFRDRPRLQPGRLPKPG